MNVIRSEFKPINIKTKLHLAWLINVIYGALALRAQKGLRKINHFKAMRNGGIHLKINSLRVM